jgi:uncharacterized protein
VIHRILILSAAMVAALPACRAEPPTPTNVQPAAQASSALSPAGLELAPLEIRTGSQVHRFTVEVARTPEEQARGLMFRRSVGPQEGMIFPFSPPRPASFWMKNTLVPLDMLFVRADGTIARIAANTVPLSLEPVAVGEPVAAVLELAGGRAAELGIKEGDRVRWEAIGG